MAHTEHRIWGLDLVRSIAIILVVFTHSSFILSPVFFYKSAVYTGFLGVELFFVLSGFLIGTILLKVSAKANPLKFKDVRVFWIRRWFRTLPNYYLMFLVYAGFFYAVHHVNVFAHFRYFSYLFFLQNSFSTQPNEFFPIAWSLSVEEWFYLLFPLLLLLLSKMVKGQKGKYFMGAVLAIIIIELLIRIGVSLSRVNYWDEGYRKLMPLRLDAIDIGVLAAWIRFFKPDFWQRRAVVLFAAGAVLLTALSIYFYWAYMIYSNPVFWDHKIKTGLFLNSFFFTLSSISVALALPYLCRLEVKWLPFKRAVTFISKISYSMYLTHFLIILALRRFSKLYFTGLYANIILFITVWAVTILVSAIQYRYFEVKVTALRDRFSGKQAAIKV